MVWTFCRFQIHYTKYSNLDNGLAACISRHWSACLHQTRRLMCKAHRTPDINSPAMITTRLQNRGGTTTLIQSKANGVFLFRSYKQDGRAARDEAALLCDTWILASHPCFTQQPAECARFFHRKSSELLKSVFRGKKKRLSFTLLFALLLLALESPFCLFPPLSFCI